MVIRDALKEEIFEKLYWDNRLNSANIRVETDDNGNVILEGHAPTRSHKFLAEEIVLSLKDVKSVKNEISVALSDVFVFNEKEEDVIKSLDFALTFCPEVPSSGIDLNLTEGVLTLRGNVRGYWQKECALEMAKRVAKDYDINDQIEVIKTEEMSDKQIIQIIKNSLKMKGFSNSEKIKINSEGGEIILEGDFEDGEIMEKILDSIRFCEGVKNISTKIELLYDKDERRNLNGKERI